ncbi:hypothetical protein ACH5RR_019826 [Cinchona calisaya]|uniref:SET domain-containing protein n=1 Tax=Cinchona calisaya TaxID=153742 RepID=A0ABD2ZT94_9GENT
MSKKRWKLSVFNPTEYPTRRLEQMASLATALTATGTEFSNDLTYVPRMAPRSADRAKHEREGMQNMIGRGELPPLMDVFDSLEGFTVETDRFIRDLTIITEDGKKKQNVKCVRFDVNGDCRDLLNASRDITKGERLYYDYNGYEHEYPTEHFVKQRTEDDRQVFGSELPPHTVVPLWPSDFFLMQPPPPPSPHLMTHREFDV